MSPVDAVVVGAGPNGLAAAVVLAAAGLQVEVLEAAPTIGGGARTSELTLPGFRHDVCSAVHPLGVASPFLRAFDLARRGVEMLQPDVAYAQPLDGGRAGLAWRDLERTADGLGPDGAAWRALLGPLAARWESLVGLLLSDFRSVPRDLRLLAAFGRRVVEQGSPAWNRRFRCDVAPALLTGVSAHAIAPPRALAPAGAGLFLGALAHARGWPIPRGGSQTLVDAMAAAVTAHGGTIRTGHPVGSLAELPRARAVLLDVSPRGLLELARGTLPSSYAHWLERFRYGSAVCKVDFALSAPVPWAAPGCELAGTLHLGGTRAEMAATEADVAAGRHSRRPFVIASQPGVVDPTRAPSGGHTLWTYAHVPAGSTRDLGEEVTAQVERFAPGFRDVVLHRSVMTAAEEAQHNANYVGGDIASGAPTPWQMVMRPVPRWDPYRTPLEGTYLCSASTPPGPAVHGMGGVHAARRALRQVFGERRDPLDLVRALD
ncbi:NAD(P)/FAD-dependent oxidoreductase [Angustibacter sp. Root456]|uniref:phytoene desaturase family protein n=1 Tax=Angustibacter sp. Root456 TaxID=1736539 RepID=UPI0006FC8BE8|nr:NAD(P)/FAD-dependent oxidoreductase [Angustibacter sp. Root456]KQX69384.1 dehydrogenase [Angustibacter sp. Root456]